jgi:hypothetical protein
MGTSRKPHIVHIWTLVLFALLAVGAEEALAQRVSAAIPENSRATSYGNGRECERGCQQIDGTCAVVTVPTNGYYVDSAYGPGWTCNRGQQPADQACVAMKIPENAHFGFSENDRQCPPALTSTRERLRFALSVSLAAQPPQRMQDKPS